MNCPFLFLESLIKQSNVDAGYDSLPETSSQRISIGIILSYINYLFIYVCILQKANPAVGTRTQLSS